jgi:Rieske Fe-S protein
MQRRTFLAWMTRGLSAVVGAVLAVPGIAYLIDPRRLRSGNGEFKPVSRLDVLKPGVPLAVAVRDERHDAWTRHPVDVVGRVWLVRQPDNTIKAFSTVCPHLGCSINLSSDRSRFVCPCHNGVFRLNGERVPDKELRRINPVPRGMDELETHLADGVVLVKFAKFQQGLAQKLPKA